MEIIHTWQKPQGFCDNKWSSVCEHTTSECEHALKISSYLQVQDEGRVVMEVELFFTKDNESHAIWFDKSNSELVAGLLCQ